MIKHSMNLLNFTFDNAYRTFPFFEYNERKKEYNEIMYYGGKQ